MKRSVFLLLLVCALSSCTGRREEARHAAQARDVTITAVPLLTKELVSTYAFLAADFRAGGVLDGKEVYAFVPDNVTVFEGDTIRFTLINPEDDAHSFVLAGLTVPMPPQSTVHASYIARRAGIFDFICDIPAHKPMMYGQLVVLRPD